VREPGDSERALRGVRPQRHLLRQRAGDEKEPIRIQEIVVHGPGADAAGGAIVLDADEAIAGIRFNDHILIADCQFLGYPPGARTIVPLQSSAAGKNVEIRSK